MIFGFLVRYSYTTHPFSNDIKSRLMEYNSDRDAGYTTSRRPVELVGISPEMTKSEALKLDYRIKQLPGDKKIAALKRKENDMTIFKKDLQARKKDVKSLGRKMEKLIKEFDKSKKATVKKKVTANTTKRTPAKKALAKKRPTKLTATDKVLNILKGRKRGVNAATLVKKTGFDLKKVRNIIQRTYKQGKIKRVGKGIYVSA